MYLLSRRIPIEYLVGLLETVTKTSQSLIVYLFVLGLNKVVRRPWTSSKWDLLNSLCLITLWLAALAVVPASESSPLSEIVLHRRRTTTSKRHDDDISERGPSP